MPEARSCGSVGLSPRKGLESGLGGGLESATGHGPVARRAGGAVAAWLARRASVRARCFSAGLAACAVAFVAVRAAGPPGLPAGLKLRASRVTIGGSGVGGDMALQLLVSYSKTFTGLCASGGTQPFFCAGTIFTGEKKPAADHCRSDPRVVDVGKLPDYARRHCGAPPRPRCLDDVRHLARRNGARVWLEAVDGNSANTQAFLAQMLDDPRAQLKYAVNATPEACLDHVGRRGDWTAPIDAAAVITRRGDGSAAAVDAAAVITFHQTLATFDQTLYTFDQTLYTAGARTLFANVGLLYVPRACAAGHCALHVLLHDCGTSENPLPPPGLKLTLGEAAYAAAADKRGVVLLLPRLQASDSDGPDVKRGCWDVWGQLGKDYALQGAPHARPIKRMVDALLGGAHRAPQTRRPAAAAHASTPRRPAAAVAASTRETGPLRWVAAVSAAKRVGQLQRLPHVDARRIVSVGASSGGDVAVQFYVAYSSNVGGACGFDAQPVGCAVVRFNRDATVVQTPQSSVPHCVGCAEGETLSYDKCKSHAADVNVAALVSATRVRPTCKNNKSPGHCIDDPKHVQSGNVFLARGECRTYTGAAVSNTRDFFTSLGSRNVKYFDQCEADGSRKPGSHSDATKMCFDHVLPAQPKDEDARPPAEAASAGLRRFDQRPFIDDAGAGLAAWGYVYVPAACAAGASCGAVVRFHGCGSVSPPSAADMQLADARRVALLHPSVAVGNNATSTCHTGDAMAGNCKEIARGCWDGYGQLGAGYALQDAPHMAAAWKMLAHLARLDSSHAS